MRKKDAEKLRLLADYIDKNTTLPIDVREFLLECATRAESWGGNLPYKPKDVNITPKEGSLPPNWKQLPSSEIQKIFDNMDKDL